MPMTHNLVGELLGIAGSKGFDDRITYQDYLYELCSDGFERKPISEEQWEAMCSIIGANRRPIYASSVKHAIENIRAKVDGKVNRLADRDGIS